MKKTAIILIIFALSISSFAQSSCGTVKESLTIDSKILGKQVKFSIYLPVDYETSNRFYPVVYLLHGLNDNEVGWIQYGEINLIADESIANREIPPMILVMPNGGASYYMNTFDGKVKYEDFFINEFIPFIEKNYRIRAEKRYRGIAGLSMGGFGTLYLSLKYPEKFAACAAFSPVIFSDTYMKETDDKKFNAYYAPLFGSYEKGEKRITDYYRKNNPTDMTLAKEKDAYNDLKIYIDCGDDDYLTDDNCRFNVHLNKLGIKHEFRMRDGAHNWTYWRSGVTNGLKFIGDSFRR